MNDLGELAFIQYAIKHNQIDLTYICIMLSSIDAFTQFCHPSYDMKSKGSEPHLRSCKQNDLHFIYIMVSSVDAVYYGFISHTIVWMVYAI